MHANWSVPSILLINFRAKGFHLNVMEHNDAWLQTIAKINTSFVLSHVVTIRTMG